MKHDEDTFRDTRVAVDGHEYRGCKFIRCTIVYSGGAPPQFVDCLFQGSTWAFEDAASRTIAFMTALYHGMGEGGRALIEQTFEAIRRGGPGP